ncbi:hypothetical protein JCM16303_003766 [Sporobolomyces ruberrimus]
MTDTALRPRPSYATTAADESTSQYASAQSYLQDTTQESMWTAPSRNNYYLDERPSNTSSTNDDDNLRSHDSNNIEILSTSSTMTPKRPPFVSMPSSISTISSSGSEVDMSGPLSSPFFVPPSRVPPSPKTIQKENIARNRTSFLAPTPRPNSPLPPLPPPKSTARHLRGPSNTTTTSNAPYRAPPLTEYNSLASFQAHHLVETKPTTSEDSHRTSSDVDLDISFDYESRPDQNFSDEHDTSGSSRSKSGSSEGGDGTTGEGSLERLEDEVMRGGWVGIEMSRPQEHGIPEGQLVRSGSGKLVGARASKARSALDLRAQFRAAESERQQAKEQDVSIVVMEELGNLVEQGAEDEARRREIRAGKRPVEGERADWTRADRLDKASVAQRRRSAGFGFAYNTTGSLNAPSIRQAPHSAPLLSEPVFASQQQQHQRKPSHQVVDLSPFSAELDQAKRTKAFPLPLRLIDRSKRPPLNSPPKLGSSPAAKGSRQSLVYYDSDVASSEPSPLFDHHTDDEGGGGGTNRTAPSTPNDTPLYQECFSDEETTPPPLPDKEGALAGLGFDFDVSETSPSPSSRDEFPVVPLRRRSLPPPATRRMSNRHMPIPSLSISPPSRTNHEPPLEDILETDSSRSSTDSSIDPTVSPSRRISRRLSSSNPGLAGIGATRRQSFVSGGNTQTSTPPSDRGGGTIITPQHLLITPSDAGHGSTPSFSFSPAPLRLVKAQLLRAAGYKYDNVPTSSPPLDSVPPSPSFDSIHHATSSPRKKPATPQPQRERSTETDPVPRATNRGGRIKRSRVGTTLEELSDLLSSSAETWIDEVIPAKLAFIAGFLLGPWCWIIGGWYLRPQDGELPRSRGQRCRTPTCNCGRILRGSTSRQQAQHTTTRRRNVREREEDDWAGLDKWVFGNRVAACGGGFGIAVLVGVAVWAAASA